MEISKEAKRGRRSGLATAEFYHEENKLVASAVAELAVKVVAYKKKHGTSVVLLTGCNAACGTSRTSVNLAIALSDCGFKTLLINADLQAESNLKNGFSEYIQGDSTIDNVISKTNLSNLYFVPNGTQTEKSALLLSSEKVVNFISSAKESHDYVIIDCPSIDVSPNAFAMFANVDGIILVCSLNKTTKKQIINAKNAIKPYFGKYYGMVVHSMEARRYKRYLQRRKWRVTE